MYLGIMQKRFFESYFVRNCGKYFESFVSQVFFPKIFRQEVFDYNVVSLFIVVARYHVEANLDVGIAFQATARVTAICLRTGFSTTAIEGHVRSFKFEYH